MAAFERKDKKKEESGRAGAGDRRRPTRRKICKFCAEKVSAIDYQDTTRLVKMVSERGKILPRRVSGNCARHQRQMSRAIQRARAVALMPYVAD
jgi:small subunit ribosomal protein S18